MAANIRVRRVYDEPAPDDGARVLVDRIWPRGLRKDAAHLSDWAKDVAPSTELRTWYGHDPARFTEFRRRYKAELAAPEQNAALDKLRRLAAAGPLTLLTATRETDISQAAVLAGLLRDGDRTTRSVEKRLDILCQPHAAGLSARLRLAVWVASL
jgi:uncharacterized protein YeaO (DUF488 family)